MDEKDREEREAWTGKIGMMLRAARKVETISADIALKLAEMVFRRNYGALATDNQLPLIVRDMGDSWEVVGSTDLPSSTALADPVGGRLRIVIAKVDCQIKDLNKILLSG